MTHRRMSDDRTRVLANQLLRYLAQHPDAADTVEGILQWWLPRETARYRESEVQAALEWLVLEGALVRSNLPDGRGLYAAPGPTPPS